MEEDIKILEEQLNTYKRHLKNYEEQECLTSVYYALKEYANALEKLIKSYCGVKSNLEFFMNNCILKSKIEEKIKELGNMLQETAQGKLQKYTPKEICCFIEVLQELLESEENK